MLYRSIHSSNVHRSLITYWEVGLQIKNEQLDWCVYIVFWTEATRIRHCKYLCWNFQPRLLETSFPIFVLFRPSRACSGLFTTRLAKMADAQVCSAKRRGEMKSLLIHWNSVINRVIWDVCLYVRPIHDPEAPRTPLQLTFVAVLHTLVYRWKKL